MGLVAVSKGTSNSVRNAFIYLFILLLLFFFAISWAAPAAYGSSQAKDQT